MAACSGRCGGARWHRRMGGGTHAAMSNRSGSIQRCGRRRRRCQAAWRKTAASTTPSSTVEAQHRSCAAADPANAIGARGRGRASGAPPRRRRQH
uniref:Uncharacterized protein n=1 Tax=Oryza rufipogon TaxID=4529 RepID=A0A0E0P790_ORYRU